MRFPFRLLARMKSELLWAMSSYVLLLFWGLGLSTVLQMSKRFHMAYAYEKLPKLILAIDPTYVKTTHTPKSTLIHQDNGMTINTTLHSLSVPVEETISACAIYSTARELPWTFYGPAIYYYGYSGD